MNPDREATVRIDVRADGPGATATRPPVAVHLGSHEVDPADLAIDGVWSVTVPDLSAGRHELRIEAHMPLQLQWIDVTIPRPAG